MWLAIREHHIRFPALELSTLPGGGLRSQGGGATGNVFISYRREDSAAWAGRLCDHLNALLGADRVFMDVEDIAPGDPFPETIDNTIARCEIALIVIGPKWAEILCARAQGQQRDYVCHEVEAALERQIKTVPVLVGGASAAEMEGLPGKLAALSQYEAAELRDSSFNDDCVRLAKSLRLEPAAPAEISPRRLDRKRAWMLLAAVVTLLAVLFIASGWMGIGPVSEYRARRATIAQISATARTQANRAEYQPAFRTYQNLLKIDPGNRAAMDAQVDAAMRWLENFHVIAAENAKAADVAAALLSEIAPVLDAGLARSTGQAQRSADILAHMGWAHWLNQHIAEREFGPAVERDLRQALQVDPSNVFAHAMLGNVLMQTGGKQEEALRHFRIAGASNRERPLVRELELGVLTYPRDAATRTELIRVANEMRRNGEPLDDRDRRRILIAYSPTVNSAEELSQTLAAVPPADAWATYLWLDEPGAAGTDHDAQQIQQGFIHACLLEVQGVRQDALPAFERLRGELKLRGYNGRIATHVDAAIARLSKH